MFARIALLGGLAAGLVAGIQGPALAATWHVQGGYDSGISCSYAGYYGWLNDRWDDYYCSKEPANPVWWLLVFY